MNFLQKLSADTPFSLCFNLLPHFTLNKRSFSDLTNILAAALQDGRIQTFFLSDRPAQQQDFSSLQLARQIIAAGGVPVVSLGLASDDRNSTIDRLNIYIQSGIRHFVFVSGDYPAPYRKNPKYTGFDIDSVQLLMLLDDKLQEAGIHSGCVVNPFKYFESEQIWQYQKLLRKIEVGADFIITQIGYDLRKYDELRRFCLLQKIEIPLVANVFAADMGTADLIQARSIPGVKIPGTLIRQLQAEKSGRQPVVERTAKTLAVMKGLGYHGALLGSSNFDYNEIQQILDRAERLEQNWQRLVMDLDFSEDQNSRYYYFQKDPQNGLNTNEPAPVALKHFPTPTYSFSYFVDWLVYVPRGPLFSLTGRFCHFCRQKKFWYGFLWLLEYLSKKPLYGCRMCGDCTLYACGFLCYQAGCPKKQVNGPCGGSVDGYCEVYPASKRCFWVKVYHNMKGVSQQVSFKAPPIPPRDAALDRTSSWINFFMGRDHRRMDFGKMQE